MKSYLFFKDLMIWKWHLIHFITPTENLDDIFCQLSAVNFPLIRLSDFLSKLKDCIGPSWIWQKLRTLKIFDLLSYVNVMDLERATNLPQLCRQTQEKFTWVWRMEFSDWPIERSQIKFCRIVFWCLALYERLIYRCMLPGTYGFLAAEDPVD